MIRGFADEVLERGLTRDIEERTDDGDRLEIALEHQGGLLRWHFFNGARFRVSRASELDLLTCPYVFTPEEARAMAGAGADVIVPHMGLTTKGTIGATSAKTLDQSVELVQAMHDAAKEVNPEILVLCHGGPIAEPEDAAYVLERTTGVVGFFGASSMERLPTEVAMTENMKRFKAIPVTS